jgi:hypothetical protein
VQSTIRDATRPFGFVVRFVLAAARDDRPSHRDRRAHPRGDDAFGGTAVNGCWKYRRSGQNLDDVDENTVDWLVGESGGTGIKAELKDTSVTGGLLFGKIFIQHEPVAYSF